MLKINEDTVNSVRDKLADADPVAVGYRLMVKPIPARKGLEASEGDKYSELASKGFEVKGNDAQERESHGSDIGIVVHVGPDAYGIGNLADREPWAKEGDVVMFPRYCGHICEVPPGSGEKYHFMTDDDLLGKYEGIEL
jgi:co-chaperonin GroES (HSP10)